MIVNLQKTPKDKKAALLIRGKADEVMRAVMSSLQIPVPAFVRQDTFLLHTSQHSGSGKGISLEARVSSIHGPECTMPLVQSVDISFPVSREVSCSIYELCWLIKSASCLLSCIGSEHENGVRQCLDFRLESALRNSPGSRALNSANRVQHLQSLRAECPARPVTLIYGS